MHFVEFFTVEKLRKCIQVANNKLIQINYPSSTLGRENIFQLRKWAIHHSIVVRVNNLVSRTASVRAFRVVWIFPEVQTGQFVARIKRARKRCTTFARHATNVRTIARNRGEIANAISVRRLSILALLFASNVDSRQKLSSLSRNI